MSDYIDEITGEMSREELIEEIKRYKGDYDRACKTINDLYFAGTEQTGESFRGVKTTGLVEDVEAHIKLLKQMVTSQGPTTLLGAALQQAQEDVKVWCQEKGWWDDGRTFGDTIALIHSEVSEALEAYREYGMEARSTFKFPSGQAPPIEGELTPERLKAAGILPKPEGVGSEFADILVRLLHACALYEFDLAEEFTQKMEYNWTRTHRHGGRRL